MASSDPGGAIRSFAGASISVAGIGFPSITRAPVEAYAQTLGQTLPVDMLNGQTAPRKDSLKLQLLIRAADTSVTPWPDVMNGYRAIQGLPEVGTLVMDLDATGGGTVSCTARRKPIDLNLSPSNARHLVLDIEFTLITAWQ